MLILSPFYDVVFLQKVPLNVKGFNILKLLKKKMVFDFDDAIYTTIPGFTDSDFGIKSELANRMKNILSTDKLLVVLENKITKQFAEQYNKNILVITGPIDTERYFPAKKGMDNDRVVIGWIGSSSTTPYLSILFPVFRRLCRTHPDAYIKLIGAAPINIPDVRVKQVDWDLETEVEELQEFDIGIMPLPDDEWTRGKGGYKLLQYMAVGIPCVASPVGINKDLIKDGENGFLSATEEEWYEKLSLLIDNPEIRKKMGLRERDFVVKNYSFEVAAPKLISVLKSLL
jgi:glycosyltransferase involved in cell wall biosynthesis